MTTNVDVSGITEDLWLVEVQIGEVQGARDRLAAAGAGDWTGTAADEASTTRLSIVADLDAALGTLRAVQGALSAAAFAGAGGPAAGLRWAG